MEMRVLLITTGGTIDKVYGTGSGVRDLHIGRPVAPDILRRMKFYQFDHVEVCRKDSLDMNDIDRSMIARVCQNADTSCIIITHGTDTMIETARAINDLLGSAVSHRILRIVLAGAAQPACVLGSDAEFNLGLALATCLDGHVGIRIAMNGVHEWHACRKNPKTGVFEEFLEPPTTAEIDAICET